MTQTKTNGAIAAGRGKRGNKVLQATQDAWKAGLWNRGITELVEHYKSIGQPVSRQVISRTVNSGYATEAVRRLINDFLDLDNELYV